MFPDGTQFRVTYKGRTYTAEIKDGVWVGADGDCPYQTEQPNRLAVAWDLLRPFKCSLHCT
jgi:hypothetical protein